MRQSVPLGEGLHAGVNSACRWSGMIAGAHLPCCIYCVARRLAKLDPPISFERQVDQWGSSHTLL